MFGFAEKTSDNEFLVDVNGTEIIIQIPLNSQSEKYIPTDIVPVSVKYSEILSNSKKLIYQYIDSSTILGFFIEAILIVLAVCIASFVIGVDYSMKKTIVNAIKSKIKPTI